MKLTDIELLAIIESHRADSLGVEDGELSNERATALDRYHGRPYGNEMEGRSAVVSKDLSEAVDWAMPAIMRIFTQSGTVAEFDPVSQEDEAQAEIETEYTNQVIMRDNNGWIILHDAIKDTLLLKNGYVKHWWETTEKIEEPKYRGLVIQEVQQMMQELEQDGAEIKIKGQEERQIMTPQGPMAVYDIDLRIVRKVGKVCIEAVPCEEIRVSRKCRGTLQESPFVEHVTRKTRSDLIEMGMEREFVDLLPSYSETTRTGAQSFSRDSVSDERRVNYGNSVNDRSMDEIEYCEAYVRVDFDDDGVAELRRVVSVGNQIPDGEEWNQAIPEVAITGFVAKRVPHRHVGESIFDDLGDLMEIKTVLQRQLLDNIYLINNSQTAINERCNVGDFMVSLPGGLKRIDGIGPVGDAFHSIVTPSIIGELMPAIDYIDRVKESRTGITKASSGLDPETLSNVTKGAFMENMSRASQKVEMITRMIAETGVKEMVLRVHSLLTRYQDKQRIIRMKGKYVPVNPQGWRERTDVTVKVGLGTGNEEDKQRKLMMLTDLQGKMLGPVGLVDAKHAFALFSDLVKTLGFDMPDKYALSPDSPEYQQKMQKPQTPLPVQIEQMKQQGAAQKTQFVAQQDQQRLAMEDQQHQREMQRDMLAEQNRQEMQARDTAHTAQLDAQKAQYQARLDQERHNAEMNHSMQMEQMRVANEREIAEMTNAAKIQATLITAKQATDLASIAAQQASNSELARDMKDNEAGE